MALEHPCNPEDIKAGYRPSSLSGDTSGPEVDNAGSFISWFLSFSPSIEHPEVGLRLGKSWMRIKQPGYLQSIWPRSHVASFREHRPVPSTTAHTSNRWDHLYLATEGVRFHRKFLLRLTCKGGVRPECPSHCDVNSAKYYLCRCWLPLAPFHHLPGLDRQKQRAMLSDRNMPTSPALRSAGLWANPSPATCELLNLSQLCSRVGASSFERE